jgi:ribA/ribD-fused uncharacterized protein
VNDSEEIQFSGTDSSYLSNCSSHPIVLDGYLWKTVEHFFHAQKFSIGGVRFMLVHDAPSPQMARRLSENLESSEGDVEPVASDWLETRLSILRRGVRAKFTQHPELREALVATKGRNIVCKSIDRFMGIMPTGAGENMLGKVLVELRQQFLDDDYIAALNIERRKVSSEVEKADDYSDSDTRQWENEAEEDSYAAEQLAWPDEEPTTVTELIYPKINTKGVGNA